jgi:hypothetical protein
VETPDAFSLVDANTLVFGIHMELRTYHQALARLPGVFIGAGLNEWERVIDFDPDVRGLVGPISKMDATYARYSFPDMNYMFSGTTLYWRRNIEESCSPEDEILGGV